MCGSPHRCVDREKGMSVPYVRPMSLDLRMSDDQVVPNWWDFVAVVAVDVRSVSHDVNRFSDVPLTVTM